MKLVIPNYYEKALSLFGHRLQIKHKIKGLGHREKSFDSLGSLLKDEIKELSDEFTFNNMIPKSLYDIERLINEALDVMICGLIIVDRGLQEIENNVKGKTT